MQNGREHDAMESQQPPRGIPQDADFSARLQALHNIKQEMEQLHAHLQYLRLMLRLGVRLQ